MHVELVLNLKFEDEFGLKNPSGEEDTVKWNFLPWTYALGKNTKP